MRETEGWRSLLRYLIISDLHAGLEAFEQCLRIAATKYDEVVCLGDVVGYGPDPNAVIDLLTERSSATVRGNHDKACCGIIDADDFNPWARAATYWTRSVLTEAHREFLHRLPAGPKQLNGFEMVHGSAQDEDEYVMGGAAAQAALERQRASLVFFGHTHHQTAFSMSTPGTLGRESFPTDGEGCVRTLAIQSGSRYLINPGSVGQPRDGNWRAAFAIYDDARQNVHFYRTQYDLPATQEKMARAGLPEPLIRRLEVGR